MISKRSNTASAKGRDALCVPVQKVRDMEEVSRRVPDGTGLSSAPPTEPASPSRPKASIPSREVFLVELSITSFLGSIGGEHYYGRYTVHTKSALVKKPDGSTSQVFSAGYGAWRHPHEGHDIERKIGAREASYLSKKDGEGFVTRTKLYKAGELTNRFNDKPSLIAAAIAEFPRVFAPGDLLVREEKVGHGVYEGLAGPQDALEFLASHQDYVEQYHFLASAGYLHRDSDGSGEADKTGTGLAVGDSADPKGIAQGDAA